jgi:hypothetical protein
LYAGFSMIFAKQIAKILKISRERYTYKLKKGDARGRLRLDAVHGGQEKS